MKLPHRAPRHSPDPPPNSPYVGPQPFQKGHGKLFFGRDREISDIIALLSSRRAVLLHADSGAGKTSLLNAGLLSKAPTDEFLILPPARVRGRPAETGSTVPAQGSGNTYCQNYIEDLHAQLVDSFEEHRDAFSQIHPGESLAAYADAVEAVLKEANDHRTVVYIFDQFEELFTTNLTAWRERRGFFEQARALLNPPASTSEQRQNGGTQRRLLLSMRSDYVAQVERFAHLLPERLNARYHLQRLKQRQAVDAIARPAAAAGRPFEQGAPEELARRLSEERVMSPDGKTEIIEGEFVEPVQLQVICERLWRSLPPNADRITQDLAEEYGDVEQGLTEYYNLAVSDAVGNTHVQEKQVRRWFDNKLITSGGFRSQAFVDVGNQVVDGLPLRTADRLESAYHIVRSEQRAGARWVEISHDRFVEPIRKSNQEFNKSRTRRLNQWVVAASLTVLVALGGGLIYQQLQENEQAQIVRQRAIAEERFSSAVIAALGSGALRDRAQKALDALAIRKDAQSIGAGYTVLADLRQIRRILSAPFQISTSRAALAMSPEGGLLVGEWREGYWRIGSTSPGTEVPASLESGTKRGLSADPLAWSRDGRLLAGVGPDGSPVVIGGDLDTGSWASGRILSFAFDSSGRYLAALFCGADGKSACTSQKKILIWELQGGSLVRTFAAPDNGDPRRLALAWPQDARDPWLAVLSCVPRLTEQQQQQQQQQATNGSGGDTAATVPRTPQQTVGAPREVNQPLCDEYTIRARSPDAAALLNSDTETGQVYATDLKSQVWNRINLRGEFSEIAFSADPGAVSATNAVLIFVERQRDPAAFLVRRIEATSSYDVDPSIFADTLVTTTRAIRGLLQIDVHRFAWIDSEEGIVIAQAGPEGPLTTVIAQRDLGTIEESLKWDWGGVSRPAFVEATGNFLYRGPQAYLQRSRQGHQGTLFPAPLQNDPVDNVILSSDGRYVFAYGIGGWPGEQDLALYDRTEGHLLFSTMTEDAPSASTSPWAALVEQEDRAVFAFGPNSGELASLSEEGTFSTWDVRSGINLRTGQVTFPEDVKIGDPYDFHILQSIPLGVLVGDGGALAIDIERLTAIPLVSGTTVSVASLAGDSHFATGSEDGVAIWDAEQVLAGLRSPGGYRPAPLSFLESAGDIVVDLAVDNAQRQIVGALYEGAIQLWDMDSGQRIGKPVIAGQDELIGLAFDSVSRRALTAHLTEDATMILVDLSTAGLEAALCQVIAGSLPDDPATAERCPRQP